MVTVQIRLIDIGREFQCLFCLQFRGRLKGPITFQILKIFGRFVNKAKYLSNHFGERNFRCVLIEAAFYCKQGVSFLNWVVSAGQEFINFNKLLL